MLSKLKKYGNVKKKNFRLSKKELAPAMREASEKFANAHKLPMCNGYVLFSGMLPSVPCSWKYEKDPLIYVDMNKISSLPHLG